MTIEFAAVRAPATRPLSSEELRLIDAWWRACNYLSVGMIYVRDNPLLREPLKSAHVKRRRLGHWDTDPALSFVWAHVNRVIAARDVDVIFVVGPGHGAPGVLRHVYVEGPRSEIYPDKSEDAVGLGSIHEGGELGYSLSHAYGMVFDTPDLILACVFGDGDAETGPLATAWLVNKFINPIGDGAVLPILNLNGYKIAPRKAPPPKGARPMSANPHATGALRRKELRLPDFRAYHLHYAPEHRIDRPEITNWVWPFQGA